jgi:hypothetical protein
MKKKKFENKRDVFWLINDVMGMGEKRAYFCEVYLETLKMFLVFYSAPVQFSNGHKNSHS